MKNFDSFQLIATHIERVSGDKINFRELIEEKQGDEEKALQILGYAYVRICRLYGKKPEELKGIEELVKEENEIYEMGLGLN